MKQVFTIVVITVFMAAGFGCTGRSANSAITNANIEVESPFASITDPNAALAEGDRLFDENQTEMAIQAYQQAVKLNPDFAEAHFKLGIAYALLDMQIEQSGVITGPETKDARAKTRSQKAFEKAVEAYKKWLTANPDDDVAHFNLARTYNKLDKVEEAEKEFRVAVKLKPNDGEYQTELGGILIRLAQYREAIGPLKKAIEIDAANERAASLLEDAEAGRQRLDYVSVPKNSNQSASNSASTSNGNVNAASNSNSAVKPPDGNSNKSKPVTQPTKPPVKGGKTESKAKTG
ncbi:MAG: tetratricopeptide repeat protein [Pyrinomonadaceae bacterium]